MAPHLDPTPCPDANDQENENVSDFDEDEEYEDDHDSYQRRREAPSPPPVPTNIFQAIMTAPVERLRDLLIDLSDKSPIARDLISGKLLVEIKGVREVGKKRKAHETCKNCKEEYAVLENEMGCCVFHEGEKDHDPDSSTWDDHDYDIHGEPDDLEDDPTYEDGFVWNCCGVRGGADGCVISRHVPEVSEPVAVKRREILESVSVRRALPIEALI